MIVIKINIENIESVSLEICEQLHLDDKYKIPIIKLNMHIILIIHFFIGCSFNFPKYVPQYKIINVTANAKRNNIELDFEDIKDIASEILDDDAFNDDITNHLKNFDKEQEL